MIYEIKKRKPEDMPDPALLTWNEYYKEINPQDKFHDSSAYQVKLGDIDWKLKNHDTLINTFKSNGLTFKILANVVDLWNLNFVKKDENGNNLTIDGKVQYYSKEELKKLKPSRYDYTFIVVNEDDQVVASAENEWGALLIRVVKEYRNFGIGTLLGKLARKYEPYKDSGGFTAGGLKNAKRVHTEFVRNYLANGTYSKLVRDGKISIERVQKILNSANVKERKPKKELDLSFNDPKDWLLWYGGYNSAILYDKKLKDLFELSENGKIHYKHLRKGIKAHIHVEQPRSGDDLYIYDINYSNDHAGKLIVQIMKTILKNEDSTILKMHEHWDEVNRKLNKLGYTISNITESERSLSYSTIKQWVKKEHNFRKSFDKYGEFENRILEFAETGVL